MHTDQRGFGATGILLILAVVGVLGAATWLFLGKSDDPSANGQQSETAKAVPTQPEGIEPDIVLQNIGLKSIDDLEVTQQAVREYQDKGLKGFYVFGDTLSGNRQNPNFEYASMRKDASVVAAIDGIIGFVRQQPESKDYEVFLQPKEGSQWTIGYDHLVNVKVKKGDMVKAGDPLGTAAIQNNGLYRFEFQVNKDVGSQTTHICPTTLLDPKVKDTVVADMTAMQNKWESMTGLDLYDLDAQKPVGCIKQTLTPKEAEGNS